MVKMSDAEIQRAMAYCLRLTIDYLEANGLHYVIAAGTLLGAVRHHGFIPWDNDTDIVMPYDDYILFQQYIQRKPIHPDIYVSTLKTEPAHYWPMTKVFLTTTYLIEDSVLPQYSSAASGFSGVYVDIFPAYGVPDDANEQRVFCAKLGGLWSAWRLAAKGKNHVLSSERLPKEYHPEITNPRYYIAEMENMISAYSITMSKSFGCTLGAAADRRDINPTPDLYDTVTMRFEDIDCKAPRNYDRMLRKFYGDYMVIPPIEKRIRHTVTSYYRDN